MKVVLGMPSTEVGDVNEVTPPSRCRGVSMHYTITVSRHGVPHEEWTADTGNAHAAVDASRYTRQHTREHEAGDTYDATPTLGITDEDALAFAYAHAATLMPSLLDLLDDDAVTTEQLPAWLGADAEPLTCGGVL